MKDTYIKDSINSAPDESQPNPKKKKSAWLRFVYWFFGGIFSLILLFFLTLCGLTWWYNPSRLAKLISKEVSEEINGDLKLSEVKYSLWLSFPHLDVEIDTIVLRSRNFDSIPSQLKNELPPDADRLLSALKFKGSINIIPLLSHRIYVKDIELDSLDVNLVALDDSLNNYTIVPTGGKSEIPYFHIDGFTMGHSGRIAYNSVATSTEAKLNLNEFSLEPSAHSRNNDKYNLDLKGLINLKSGDFTILNYFPIGLSGDVGLRFDPFGISTDDYHVALGNIKGEMTMNMNIGTSPAMESFAYSLRDFTLKDLLDFLPAGSYPALEHLDADLALDASARLVGPYEFSSAWLPSIEVDFRVPRGRVSYALSNGRKYEMNNVELNAALFFNGRDPKASYLEIPRMLLSGEGVDMNVSGKVTDLLSTPDVKAKLYAESDLHVLSENFPELQPYCLKGNLGLDADVKFKLDGSTLYGALANLQLKSEKLEMKSGSSDFAITDFTASTTEAYSDTLSTGVLLTQIPVKLSLAAGQLKVTDKKSDMNLQLNGVKTLAALSRKMTGKAAREVEVKINTKDVTLKTAGVNVDLSNLNLDFVGTRLRTPVKTESFAMPSRWVEDTRTRGFVRHTPEFLQFNLPATLKQLLAMWQARLDLKASGGKMGTKRYPASTSIGKLDLTASLDSVNLRSLVISSGRTKGKISAGVGNLRQFLNSSVPAPLNLSLNAAIDTIQINQLAREYTQRHPESAIARGDKREMAEGDDSIALLIPRNLRAHITASALQTRYINLHLYNLYTDIKLADGGMNIDTLGIGSDFGRLGMNLKYDTRDMQNMNMGAHVDVADVNVVNFFKNFHDLLEMMPEMKNFKGNLSATMNTDMLIFPSMYLNVPSVWADAYVRAWGMNVHQSPFIRKVTRRLLLPDDDNLHIRDITVHAGIRNNLLEVYPFEFEMSKYKLMLGGINNFNGEIYYHVGVIDWPLKIPFGINIDGDFHNPKLHFGGKSWHDKNGARIAIGVDDNTRINILSMGRRYMGEFVHTAATYQGE